MRTVFLFCEIPCGLCFPWLPIYVQRIPSPETIFVMLSIRGENRINLKYSGNRLTKVAPSGIRSCLPVSLRSPAVSLHAAQTAPSPAWGLSSFSSQACGLLHSPLRGLPGTVNLPPRRRVAHVRRRVACCSSLPLLAGCLSPSQRLGRHASATRLHAAPSPHHTRAPPRVSVESYVRTQEKCDS